MSSEQVFKTGCRLVFVINKSFEIFKERACWFFFVGVSLILSQAEKTECDVVQKHVNLHTCHLCCRG